jgi:hypothetical protein
MHAILSFCYSDESNYSKRQNKIVHENNIQLELYIIIIYNNNTNKYREI